MRRAAGEGCDMSGREGAGADGGGVAFQKYFARVTVFTDIYAELLLVLRPVCCTGMQMVMPLMLASE